MRHDDLRELLPDYAIGTLDEAQAALVMQHLDTCPACRRSLADLFEIIGLLAPVQYPSPPVRSALLARVAARGSAAPLPIRRSGHLGRWRRAAARGALAAAAVLLLALGGWNLALQRQLDQRATAARLFDNPAAAHPLTDGELPGAQGVLYAAPNGDTALLLASGLPLLPPDQRYQLWLFTEDGARESSGVFAVAPDGTARVSVQPPAGFARYVAVAVSPEPVAGSVAPTGPLVLGGWIR